VSVSGATITSKQTGNWDLTSTWVGSIVPIATDIVVIASGNNVNTNGNRTCAGITITGTLSMANGDVLTVNGNVSGAGTWTTGTTNNARTISLTGNWSFNGTSTGNRAAATFTGTNDQALSGKISTGIGNAANILTINKSSGVVTLINGITVYTFVNTSGTFDPSNYLLTSTTSTFTAGTLRVGGTTWLSNYSGAITEPSIGTIEYYALGAQTVNAINYPGNLILSGSGAKTIAIGTSVTGNLNISGANADLNTGINIKVFNSANTIFVQNLSDLNGEMVIYDIMGRYLKKAVFAPYGVTAVQVGTTPGAYVVKAATSNESVSKKIIIGKE
jgi:hypothetical protein